MNTYFRALLVVLIIGVASSSYGQASRTWVSGVGDDANPCSRTAPCKTFAGAISKTATGGQISVLDPGGFGAVTITKSITLDGTGTLGSILASGTNGVVINAAGGNVILRSLQIDGNVTGLIGVRILAAATVTIENCVILNFQSSSNSHGVSIETPAKVRIINTQILNSAGNGVFSGPASGTATLALENVTSSGNAFSGVQLTSNTKATVSRSSLVHNGQAGVILVQGTAEADVIDSVLSLNAYGVFSGVSGAPVARISGCQLTNNTSDGVHLGTGQVFSHGNNAIQNNSGNQTTSGVIGQQ